MNQDSPAKRAHQKWAQDLLAFSDPTAEDKYFLEWYASDKMAFTELNREHMRYIADKPRHRHVHLADFQDPEINKKVWKLMGLETVSWVEDLTGMKME